MQGSKMLGATLCEFPLRIKSLPSLQGCPMSGMRPCPRGYPQESREAEADAGTEAGTPGGIETAAKSITK